MFLHFIGDNDVLKAIQEGCKDSLILSVDGDKITYIWDSPVRHEYVFKFGEEFDGKDTFGKPVKVGPRLSPGLLPT